MVRVVLFSLSIALVLFLMACGPTPPQPCQENSECLFGELCHPNKKQCVRRCQNDLDCVDGEGCQTDTGLCLPKCQSDDDCSEGKACSPKQVCTERRCPDGSLPDDSGQCKQQRCKDGSIAGEKGCPCSSQEDCAAGTYCDALGGTQGRCQSRCPVTGQAPDAQGTCVCPKGLKWFGTFCSKPCHPNMIRRTDGVCQPNLAKLAPDAWEPGPNERFLLKCPQGWTRDKDKLCHRTPLISTLPPDQRPGPQKACPSDPSDQYDEAYLKQPGVSATQVLYVNASAQEGGNGTKTAPFRTIQDATSRAQSGAVILIAPGNYRWGIDIKKPMHIIGRCTKGVLISANASGLGIGFDIYVGGVTISGLSLIGNNDDIGILSENKEKNFTLSHVHVKGARDFGVVSDTTNTLIEHCLIEGIHYGNQQIGAGVQLQEPNASGTIRRNIIRNNAWLGVNVLNAGQLTIQDNLISGNGTTGLIGRGIYVNDTKADIQIEENHILNNTDVGIYISRSFSGTIRRNLVEGSGSNNEKGRGIFLAENTGRFVLTENQIQQTAYLGVFILLNGPVTLTNNLIASNGAGNQKKKVPNGIGLSIEENKAKVEVIKNQFLNNTGSHISIFESKEVVITANAFGNIGATKPSETPTSTALYIKEHASSVTLTHNYIWDNVFYALQAEYYNTIEAKENILSAKGVQMSILRGLFLSQPNVALKMTRNLITDFIEGMQLRTYIARTQKDTSLTTFDGNVWSHHRSLGANIVLSHNPTNNSVTFANERFLFNGGSHLIIRNTVVPVQIKDALFIKAKSTAARPKDPTPNNLISSTSGVGAWIGAVGLIRFVYAKDADFQCSPTQKGLLSSLKDGWTMRPIRIPHQLDPCIKWDFIPTTQDRQSGIYRSLDSWKALSQCALLGCEKKGQYCRWTWQDAGRGENKNKGVWEPLKLECADNPSHNTCSPPANAAKRFRSFEREFHIFGFCVPKTNLADGDPCKGMSSNTCPLPEDNNISTELYCSRYTQQTPSKTITTAQCSSRKEPDAYCNPRIVSANGGIEHLPICDNDHYCFDQYLALAPLNPRTPDVTITGSLFWDNKGPDLLMDLAGQIKLSDNSYGLCVPDTNDPNCQTKKLLQPCVVDTKDPTCQFDLGKTNALNIGVKHVELPPGASILWMNPTQVRGQHFESKLEGNDRTKNIKGKSLLLFPTACQTF